MASYMSGTLVRSKASFKNLAGAAADPDDVTLQYQVNAGSTQDATPIKDTTGEYHTDFDTTGFSGPGNQTYVLLWTGTGTVQAIGSDTFVVTPPPF